MLPFDLINYILFLSNIKCVICNKKVKIIDKYFFRDSYSNKYYCSQECYNFI